MKNVNFFNLLIYDKADQISGAVCISMSKYDVFFDVFEYSEELGRIANTGFSGIHFHLNERFKNYQLVDAIDKMLVYLDSLVGKVDLHIDMSSFYNLKDSVDFRKFYLDNFSN